MRAVADTGCTISVISAKLADAHQLCVEQNNNRFALQAANKTMMNVVGTVELKATTVQEPTSAVCYCLVSNDLVDDMLVSSSDLVSLRRLHEGFPNVRVNSCLLYTSPSPRDLSTSRMPSSA